MCSRLCSGVNELNNDGETPLHVSCRLGRIESVKALLGGGAKCDVVGGAGYAIHSAMKYSEKGWVGVKWGLWFATSHSCVWFELLAHHIFLKMVSVGCNQATTILVWFVFKLLWFKVIIWFDFWTHLNFFKPAPSKPSPQTNQSNISGTVITSVFCLKTISRGSLCLLWTQLYSVQSYCLQWHKRAYGFVVMVSVVTLLQCLSFQ